MLQFSVCFRCSKMMPSLESSRYVIGSGRDKIPLLNNYFSAWLFRLLSLLRLVSRKPRVSERFLCFPSHAISHKHPLNPQCPHEQLELLKHSVPINPKVLQGTKYGIKPGSIHDVQWEVFTYHCEHLGWSLIICLK